jgi:hypothetical protein
MFANELGEPLGIGDPEPNRPDFAPIGADIKKRPSKKGYGTHVSAVSAPTREQLTANVSRPGMLFPPEGCPDFASHCRRERYGRDEEGDVVPETWFVCSGTPDCEPDAAQKFCGEGVEYKALVT